MASLETSYQPLHSVNGDNGEETPQDIGVMIHVVPENSKSRWNHIEDLDSFFTRVYHYHQKHGFTCMMLEEFLELMQFIFIIVFSTFLLQCVNYPVLFRNKQPEDSDPHKKITLGDAINNECVATMDPSIWCCLLVALVVWLLRAVRVIYHVFQFLEIRAFYNFALKISDSELDNLTWHEVQQRLREVQREQQMCIHKQDLTELDIYHRILRFKNYMVAMVNKSLLPIHFTLPFLRETVFLSRGLKYNLELILFWGPWAPFENNWHLKEEFKKTARRKELAAFLSNRIFFIGIINFILCPVILLWQIMYSFFSYAEVIKREPGSLGARRWSIYGQLYLRHFNELSHELNARLNRAYKPATKYMDIFTSHVMTVIAKNIAFVAGAILAVLLILTIYDEDVLTVEHVLTAITVLGAILAACRVFIPDENLVWCPEKLLTAILAHIHYLPENWKGYAHTCRVRDEFSNLFQYKAVYLLQELLSPVITPVILCFYLRHRALDIVDFYRNFTVEVVGVGDVCSFAQLDVRRHGSPSWQVTGSVHPDSAPLTQSAQNTQAEDGKTELSLLHFTLTNPEWTPPAESESFITAFRGQAHRDANNLSTLPEENPLYLSLSSLGLGGGFTTLGGSIVCHPPGVHGPPPSPPSEPSHGGQGTSSQMSSLPAVRGGLSRTEGPIRGSDRGLLSSLQQSVLGTSGNAGEQALSGPSQLGGAGAALAGIQGIDTSFSLEHTATDMSFSALYLHELHRRQFQVWRRGVLNRSARPIWRHHHDMPGIMESPDNEDTEEEKLPLLEQRLAKSS